MTSGCSVSADTPGGDGSEFVAAGNEVEVLLQQFLSVARSGCDDDTALTVLAQCERIVAAAHAVQVRLLAGMAANNPTELEFVPSEVAVELGWGVDRARTRFDDAMKLTSRLPEVLHALEQGRVDLYKASMFVDRTEPLDDATAAAVVERVLPRVEGRNPSSVSQMLRHAVARVDPAGWERRHQEASAERKVVLWPLDDGMAELRATLPAHRAQAVYARVDALARGVRVPGDERSADARRADVFVNLLLGRRDPGVGDEPDGGLRPLVQVTVAASTLVGADDKPGLLAGYGPVSAAFARRIAHDPTGTWKRLITDPRDGRLLEYGRTRYRPPVALDDFVRARDRECRFYDCHRSAKFADIDHTIAWPKGPTDPDNLGVACRRHHRLKTRGIVRVEQRDGTFYWTTRTGRRYVQEPENHDPP